MIYLDINLTLLLLYLLTTLITHYTHYRSCQVRLVWMAMVRCSPTLQETWAGECVCVWSSKVTCTAKCTLARTCEPPDKRWHSHPYLINHRLRTERTRLVGDAIAFSREVLQLCPSRLALFRHFHHWWMCLLQGGGQAVFKHMYKRVSVRLGWKVTSRMKISCFALGGVRLSVALVVSTPFSVPGDV